MLDDATVEAFREDGVVLLRGVFDADWIEALRRGVAHMLATPGEYTRIYTGEGEEGHFVGDYCNWSRIPEYRDFLTKSPAPRIAQQLMGSKKVNLFHEHVLVKEPGTAKPTPWHHDQPYYCVEGWDSCSLWVPLDPVARESSVEFIKGSHKWGRWFTPTRFVGVEYDKGMDRGEEESIPDIEASRSDYDIVGYDMEPGDCMAFHFLTVHGAPGNKSRGHRRRAFAARYTGDDITFIRRSGTMSPPFPEVTLADGAPLDSETFPVVLGG